MKVTRLVPYGSLLLVVVAVFFAVYPLYIMRPFRSQQEAQLALALRISHWAPAITIAAFGVASVLLALTWRAISSSWLRVLGFVSILVTALGVFVANTNIFERMFHPRGTPDFVSNHEAHLEADDLIMSVTLGGEAHGYPIRAMGYHHIVNDTIDMVPIVATY
jgi:hypothetical protein